MKKKQTPDEKDMSYMERRDRNGCIGCMGLFACIVIFAFYMAYFG